MPDSVAPMVVAWQSVQQQTKPSYRWRLFGADGSAAHTVAGGWQVSSPAGVVLWIDGICSCGMITL